MNWVLRFFCLIHGFSNLDLIVCLRKSFRCLVGDRLGLFIWWMFVFEQIFSDVCNSFGIAY